MTIPKQEPNRILTNFYLFSQENSPLESTENEEKVENLLIEKADQEDSFIQDFFTYLGLSTLFILFGLLIGIFGYHWTAHFSWLDAMVEASMILSGMGPVHPLLTNSAKLFASFYALFSGLVFVLAMGVVLSPLVYSLLKKLRLNATKEE
ncbi:hypothetical protein [Rippkaea orientalis]|uniref:hypothetical protein n=1 Tax=Rippkaea orientalis TaxID=2546366 RepID=UPI001F4C3420|nr:hypothetical protein [Rippkaea orientalis]